MSDDSPPHCEDESTGEKPGVGLTPQIGKDLNVPLTPEEVDWLEADLGKIGGLLTDEHAKSYVESVYLVGVGLARDTIVS